MLANVAIHIGRAGGVDITGAELRLLRSAASGPDPGPPPGFLARPELLGQLHEALLPQDERRRRGVFFTPEPVAAAVVDATIPRRTNRTDVRLCDPAAGGGAFLLAAARRLARRQSDLPGVVSTCVFGADVDALAVAVTEAALAILGWDGGPPAGLAHHIVHGDALGVGAPGVPPVEWQRIVPGGFDAVVGNPPFLNQLATVTARGRETSRQLASRYGDAARGYADAACLFLLLGLDMARTGGRVGMVLPESMLATRDAAATRLIAGRNAALRWLWLGGGDVFEGAARVWAPVFEVGAKEATTVERTVGRVPRPVSPLALPAGALSEKRSWAWLFADLTGVPDPQCDTTGCIGDVARVTADFRDQFYGLVPFVVEGPETVGDERAFPRLVTSGLVDPASCRWGIAPARFSGRRYRWPRVELERLERQSRLGPWARSRLVPKVVLATQTRVLEAVVDPAGTWLPSVPTITLVATAEPLWHVAAALSSPPVTAWALREWGGTALASGAIKLSARQAAALPLPAVRAEWDLGAEAIRSAHEASTGGDHAGWREELHRAGELLCRAYRVADIDGLLSWWRGRLPPSRAVAEPEEVRTGGGRAPGY